ncbi:MAG: DNA recombination protein RmuC [Propionibacteriaceae bacterium]|nr:DNA recombination protein RmuC [Propionibacteriaceae bacterium]
MNDIAWTLLVIAVAFGAGGTLGWIVGRLRLRLAEAGASAEARAESARFEIAAAKAEAERDSALDQAAQLRDDHEAMLRHYQALSQEALDRQSKSLEESAGQRLAATERLMAPMRESVEKLQTRLTEFEKERAASAAEMRSQAHAVQLAGERLRQETTSLVNALRRPQVRGTWGELQLRRVVEIAGMVPYCDFIEQETSSTDERAIRPDLRVELSGGKFVYVDAKTPLAAFLDAQEASDPAAQERDLARFARHVKEHVDLLARKEYWKADPNTPEFVVLFIPAEALAATALEQSPDLIEYAASKNIILATPTTLIAMLRTIAHSWSQTVLAQSAREISSIGRELYERLAKFGAHLDRLGKGLEGSVKAYNDAVGSLESRVLVSARRPRDLRVSDDDLATPTVVTGTPRPLASPELTQATAEADALLSYRHPFSETSGVGDDGPSMAQKTALAAVER